MPQPSSSKRNNYGRIQGRRGVELRIARLANEPFCRKCKELGIERLSVVPDHIIALANGGTDTDANVQCLCAEHHNEKTAQDLGYRIKPRIGLDGWPTS